MMRSKLFIVLIISFISVSSLCQDSATAHYIDSLVSGLKVKFENQFYSLEGNLQKHFQDHKLKIDSFNVLINKQNEKISLLQGENEQLNSSLGEAMNKISQTSNTFKAEKSRIKRVLLIAGPALLMLIFISTFLFFYMIKNYRQRTDRQIDNIKSFINQEIAETRIDLTKLVQEKSDKLKKKLKKLSVEQKSAIKKIANKKGSRKKK
ncbi:MAG TPA: hypothetical protein VJ951_00365 [Bacteroidales bacterium]|nr:hypothetical protein [Bacteroidales bacterium]